MVKYNKQMTLYRDEKEVGKIRVRIDWDEGNKITTKEFPKGSIAYEDEEEEVRKGLEEELMGYGSCYLTWNHTYELR